MKLYDKITYIISKIAEVICMIAVGGIVIVILSELINRNIFNGSFRATIEICGILFLWMAFIGIIPLYYRSGLMRLDFLVNKSKGAVREILYFANKIASLLLGITMVYAFTLQYPFVNTRFYATIPWMPYTVQYAPMMIAGAYIAIRTVYDIINQILLLKSGKGGAK